MKSCQKLKISYPPSTLIMGVTHWEQCSVVAVVVVGYIDELELTFCWLDWIDFQCFRNLYCAFYHIPEPFSLCLRLLTMTPGCESRS